MFSFFDFFLGVFLGGVPTLVEVFLVLWSGVLAKLALLGDSFTTPWFPDGIWMPSICLLHWKSRLWLINPTKTIRHNEKTTKKAVSFEDLKLEVPRDAFHYQKMQPTSVNRPTPRIKHMQIPDLPQQRLYSPN